MKEQLITFSTAKLAKEKGFDIQTYHSKHYLEYLEDEVFDDPRKGYEITLKHKGDVICGSTRLVTVQHQSWIAPTQSLLQKWLREVHKVFIQIKNDVTIGTTDLMHYSVSIVDGRFENRFYPLWDYSGILSYEEALEKGLQEALKLIKI